MLCSNNLSTFILHHDLNRLCDNNIHSIQDLMRTSNRVREKFKCVFKDFPNMAILTKSPTPGDIQLTFVHASIGNKSPGESVTAFSLAGFLEAQTVVSIDAGIAFAITSAKIRIPVTEVLLRAAVGDFERSKKQRDRVALNAVLLSLLLTEAAIWDNKRAVANLLKVFAKCITKKGADEDENKSVE